ncbi:MAG: OmpA family protein [Humidesulfovibrio sp.]|nr:OmpA family protein [Humidesulfovibrio sp.]
MNARGIFLPLLLALALLAACAKPRNVVQLVPDPDGHVGVVRVTTAAGAAELSQAGNAVRVADAKSMPSPPEVLSEAESDALFGMAKRALPSKPVRFILYFENEGTKLTPESQALLPQVLATAQERQSRDIAIVGHASRQGDESLNITLSRRRAEFVSRLLEKQGLSPEDLEITSHGSANPLVVSTRKNEPRNRRVEITVR